MSWAQLFKGQGEGYSHAPPRTKPGVASGALYVHVYC